MPRAQSWVLLILGAAGLCAVLAAGWAASPVRAQQPGDVGQNWLFLPLLAQDQPSATPEPTETPAVSPTPSPSHTPTPSPSDTVMPSDTPALVPTVDVGPGPDLQWDPRLSLRFATVVPANVQPGQGYWKLIQGNWYDVNDFHPLGVGDHGIHFDVQGAAGVRQVGEPVRISWWTGGSCAAGLVPAEGLALELATIQCIDTVQTQSKPGEPYAGSYPMYHVAPTYLVRVDDGKPSDAVDGLGMGSIQQPGMKIHTSYGFVWRWARAAGGSPSPSPTGSPASSPTGSPRATPTPSKTPTATPPAADRIWDPRLTQRGASLIPAQVAPGTLYWRLTAGKWYDVTEQPFPGLGLILVDTRDASGGRQTGVQIAVANLSGQTLGTLMSESKPGELYAANFSMGQPAPAYQARPLGYPADVVTGMGRGSLADPYAGVRYGLTWRLTVYTAATVTPAATATSTTKPGPSATSTATPGLSATSTPTPTPALGSYLFSGYSVSSCLPQAAGTWFEGKAYLHGQPADGYRVVFSSASDGSWITLPALTGPTPDKPWDDHGHYSHIIRPASSGQPIAGDWYVWIVDQAGARISVIAQWHSTGTGPSGQGCNQAVVDFAG